MNLNSSNAFVCLTLFSIGLYLILLPVLQFQTGNIEGHYNTKRGFQILLFCYLVILLILSKEYSLKTSELINNLSLNLKIGFSVIFVVGFISSVVALHFEWALLELSSLTLLFLLTFFVAAVSRQHLTFSFKVLESIVLMAVIFYLVKFFILYSLHLFGGYPLWGAEKNHVELLGFSHRRFFNHIQTWTLPILLTFSSFESKDSHRFLILILTGLWGMLMIVTAARGAFIGVMFSFIIVALLKRKERKRLIVYFLYSVMLATVFYIVFYVFLVEINTESLLERFANKGVRGRGEEWISLIPGIIERPFLGNGPMHYAAIELNNSWAHPHSWLIQFIYEWGIPVGITVLSISFYCIYRFSVSIINSPSDIENADTTKFKIAILWAILANLIHGLVSGNFITPVSQVWFILIAGIGIASYSKNCKTSLKEKSDITIISLLLIFSFLGYGYWFVKHDGNFDNHTNSYIREYNTYKLHPRFWQQGKIGF